MMPLPDAKAGSFGKTCHSSLNGVQEVGRPLAAAGGFEVAIQVRRPARTRRFPSIPGESALGPFRTNGSMHQAEGKAPPAGDGVRREGRAHDPEIACTARSAKDEFAAALAARTSGTGPVIGTPTRHGHDMNAFSTLISAGREPIQIKAVRQSQSRPMQKDVEISRRDFQHAANVFRRQFFQLPHRKRSAHSSRQLG